MKAVRLFPLVVVSLALGAYLSLPAMSADDPKVAVTREAECRWASKPPILDGVLDDSCWRSAQAISNFASYWEKKERSGTTAYLVWDDEAIYYGGVMTDRELKSFGTKRNDSLWNGDVFEIFFKPSIQKPEYFEFQANPLETVFEVAFPGRDKLNGEFAKQPVLGNKAAVKIVGTLDRSGDVDTSWTVEGRIPWSAFANAGGKPKAGSLWSFAICRYDYGPEGTKPVLMSSAPLTQAKFHLYEDYGRLKFIGPK